MTEMFDDFFDEITAKDTPSKNTKKENKNEPKTLEQDKEDKSKKYLYPFKIHFGGETRNVDHIFTEGTEYSEIEIKEAMLNHQFYEFSGEVSFDYRDKDNVLIPIFKHHKKG